MSSYYEALPNYRAAMDVAVRFGVVAQGFAGGDNYALGARLRDAKGNIAVLVALDKPEVCGNVRRRRRCYHFEPWTPGPARQGGEG